MVDTQPVPAVWMLLTINQPLSTIVSLVLWLLVADALLAAEAPSGGQLHIPIGAPDAPDTLKTFVEPDGSFSPGFGSFGVSFRLPDSEESLAKKAAVSDHGLRGGGLPIP